MKVFSNRNSRTKGITGRWSFLALVPFCGVLLNGCFWLTSPFSGPNVTYPTTQVEALVWSPDGSKCVSIEQHTQDATSGSSFAVVTYDRDGKQVASSALGQDAYPTGPMFVDPSNAVVYFSNGTDVEQMALATGLVTPLVYSYNLVAQSASGKYLLLTNERAQQSPQSFELLDISGSRPRPVHQWAVNLATYSYPGVAWLGDSVFGYLAYRSSSALSLFVVDTNIQRHDSLETTSDLDAANAGVLGGGGNFYLASQLGITKLASGTAGTMIVQDTAAAATISRDGRVIAYCTNQYSASSLRLLNTATGKTATISSDASKPSMATAGDRVAFIESPDFYHSNVRILPVQIP